jgi:uncharacterized repeat protein (TIGR03803 family)
MSNPKNARPLFPLASTLAIFCLVLMWVGPVCGQSTYYNGKVLHNFGGPGDGNIPKAGLIFDGSGNLYGTTLEGGSGCVLPGCGSVFELTPNSDGSWSETVLHNFSGGDGANPYAPVAFDGRGNLYGTAGAGGAYGYGAIFELSPSSNGAWRYSVLHSFTGGSDGSLPYAGVAVANITQLYGTTYLGGEYNNGVVFSLNRISVTNWYELVLYPFTGGNDGSGPIGQLTLDASGSLYGTTFNGGSHGAGVVFKLTPKPLTPGWTESVLYSFQGTPYGTSADGANPNGGVVFDAAGNLYGTTQFGGEGQGGGCGCGTVFKLTPNSNGTWSESVLYAFGEGDGADPNGPLIFDGSGNLYVATFGYPTNYGEALKLSPSSGGQWTPTYLYQFCEGVGYGCDPSGGMIMDGKGNLYGVTAFGGAFGYFGTGGAVYELMP